MYNKNILRRKKKMIKLQPPMGWNTWNTFAENINEELILSSADTIVSSGLKDAGYEYIVIDDCWALRERDKNGKLVADPVKFPHGMKYVADYIHGKGLKFGMYSCCGTMTCAGYPASFGHEFEDAATFAEWGVDFLKYDYCFRPWSAEGKLLYRRMGLALANCGRDILFSGCSWGADKTHEWIRTTGANMWRSTGDINDTWESVKKLIQMQYDILPFGGQDCFNDMDMLIVGMNGRGNVGIKGCTEDEYKVHFAAWCMLGSPLMIGCDIRNMDASAKAILTNKALIEIEQDARCAQPYLVPCGNPDVPTFVRHLANGDIAVGFFNLSDTPVYTWVTTEDLAVPFAQGKTLVGTEVYTGETLRAFNGTLRIPELKEHSCKVYRMKVTDLG
jgi:alpha-galactosidase